MMSRRLSVGGASANGDSSQDHRPATAQPSMRANGNNFSKLNSGTVACDVQSLSYNNMLLFIDGHVATKERIKELREKGGYCITCLGEPVKLFEIRKSKLNPLWKSKENLSAAHESYNGVCLKCHPQMDPYKSHRRNSINSSLSNGASQKDIQLRRMDSQKSDVISLPVSSRENSFRSQDFQPSPLRNNQNQSSKPIFANAPHSQPPTSMSRDLNNNLFRDTRSHSSFNSHYFTETIDSNECSDNPDSSVDASHFVPSDDWDDFSLPDFSAAETFKSHRHNGTIRSPQDRLVSVRKPARRRNSLSGIVENSVEELQISTMSIDTTDDDMDAPFAAGATEDNAARTSLFVASFVDVQDNFIFQVEGSVDTNPASKKSKNDRPKKKKKDREGKDKEHKDKSKEGKVKKSKSKTKANNYLEDGFSDAFTNPWINSAAGIIEPVGADAFDNENLFGESVMFDPNLLEHEDQAGEGAKNNSSLDFSASFTSDRKGPTFEPESYQPRPKRDVQRTWSNDESITSTKSPEETTNDRLAEVDSLLRTVADAGSTELLTDLLVSNMKTHHDVVEIQELCLRYIWDLSKFNEDNKCAIMSAGLPEVIVKAMADFKQSVKVQECGCGAIWSLAVNEFNRTELVRLKAVERIFRALETHLKMEGFVETAFGALRTMSPDSEVHLSIGQLLGAQRVCRAMREHRQSTSIQRDGCAFLSNVAVDMKNQVVSIVTHEELEAVIRAMGDHLRNDAVLASACFALKNYTYEEKNLRALRQFDEVCSLLEDASKYSNNLECRNDAVETLDRIRVCQTDDESLEEMAYSSLLDMECTAGEQNPSESVMAIIDILQDYEWSVKLICYGMDSLDKMAKRSDEHVEQMTKRIPLLAIVNAMTKQKGNARVQEKGCDLLNALAVKSIQSRSTICDVNGSNAVLTAMRKHRGVEQVQMAAFRALRVLYGDHRCARELDRIGGLTHIRDSYKERISLG